MSPDSRYVPVSDPSEALAPFDTLRAQTDGGGCHQQEHEGTDHFLTWLCRFFQLLVSFRLLSGSFAGLSHSQGTG